MAQQAKILLVEDDPSALSAVERVLSDDGYEVTTANRGDTGLAVARERGFDVVVTDLRLPGLNGIELVRELHQSKPRLPIILVTAHGTTETAIEAIKLGAYDYLLKPFDMKRLLQLVGKAVESSRLMSEQVEMGSAPTSGDAIIGNSAVMQEIYKEIGRVATKTVTILLQGETGTGKELVARAIYQHSHRASGPFVAINCAAIPETLLESELFGHERGAFTGADVRRIGRFEQANNGTIFLDEIGDLSLNTQAKLLRVLQNKSIQRLGGKETIPIDVRVIAATHHDLEKASKENKFREDLYYRLSVVVISLPSLRQRTEDIPALVNYLLHRFSVEFGVENSGIQAEAIQFLQEQSWPGNIRELENVLRRVLLLARKYTITIDHIQQVMTKKNRPPETNDSAMAAWISDLLMKAKNGELESVQQKLFESVERELYTQAMHLAQGNQSKAARWLGVSRVTMREKLNAFNLNFGRTQSAGD